VNWFNENLGESLFILGLILLSIEVLVLGFGTFVLFFVGLSAIFTAVLIFTESIPNTGLSALSTLAVSTCLSALLLWKSLKKFQSKVDDTRAVSDLVGYRFLLVDDVSLESKAIHHYSGIAWKLRSRDPIMAGTWVEVVQADVGEFTIKARYDL
jgi:hypothetical protein